MQLNCNSKNGSDVVNFLSTQWSTDGPTSSETMGLCMTPIVKTLTDNHTLDDRNHQGHHTTLLLSDSVVHSPSKSVRRRSQELGINRESVLRFLIADLHMYPCWIQIKQKLTPDDMRKRVIMCSGFATRLTLCQTFLTLSGFRTRHIFCCQVTWTTSSGVAHPLSTVCKGHYTLWSALPGLPSPDMA